MWLCGRCWLVWIVAAGWCTLVTLVIRSVSSAFGGQDKLVWFGQNLPNECQPSSPSWFLTSLPNLSSGWQVDGHPEPARPEAEDQLQQEVPLHEVQGAAQQARRRGELREREQPQVGCGTTCSSVPCTSTLLLACSVVCRRSECHQLPCSCTSAVHTLP